MASTWIARSSGRRLGQEDREVVDELSRFRRPRDLSQLLELGEGPRPDKPIPYAEPLDPDHMQRMMDGMYGVTSEAGGTAWRSGDLGLGGPRLAGKTGTAQVRRISEAERHSGVLKGEEIDRRLRDHALFVAYAPADDPKYAISVVVEHGEGGSSTAAPVARDILATAIKRDSRAAARWQQTASAPRTGNSGGTP